MSTHTCEQSYFHLTGHNCISTKATRTCVSHLFFFLFCYEYSIVCFLIFVVVVFHLFFELVKICVVFVVELIVK